MILQDRHFLEKLEEKIAAGSSANHAVRTVIADYRAAFERIRDPYLRARSVDIKDVEKNPVRFDRSGQRQPHYRGAINYCCQRSSPLNLPSYLSTKLEVSFWNLKIRTDTPRFWQNQWACLRSLM